MVIRETNQYIHTMECYSMTKRKKELRSQEKTWSNFKCIWGAHLQVIILFVAILTISNCKALIRQASWWKLPTSHQTQYTVWREYNQVLSTSSPPTQRAVFFFVFKIFICWLILEKEEGRGERERERERLRERERDTDLLFGLCMHSLVESCVCPDWGLNTQT